MSERASGPFSTAPFQTDLSHRGTRASAHERVQLYAHVLMKMILGKFAHRNEIARVGVGDEDCYRAFRPFFDELVDKISLHNDLHM